MTETTADISTEALRTALEEQLGQPVASLCRRPWEYATSNRMEALDVELADGGRLPLLLKDLSPHAQLDEARRTRPAHHFNPRREIDVYRDVLAHVDLDTPKFYGVVGEAILIENVPGVPLWQCDYEIWARATSWLAKFHTMALPPPPASLIRYTADYCRTWAERAMRNQPALSQFDFEPVVRRLTEMPHRIIHGEFYASNVIVQDEHAVTHVERVRPVDWETAAVGPALIDLAALASGNIWPKLRQVFIMEEYLAETPPSKTFDEDLKICRLHLALQWLGWSDNWTPPREHAQDWLAEAVQLASELGVRR